MNDLISRQAALYAIYGICNEPVAWLIRAAREIEKLPSVQPEDCSTCLRSEDGGRVMTREEAIKVLKGDISILTSKIVDGSKESVQQAEYYDDAIEMAIEALSDVPDTNVGDMISRQAAIDALENTKEVAR